MSMDTSNVKLPHGIHVVHDGSPQAPPVLLIHGSGASGSTWAPIVPALAEHHRVIRVDLPGCGQSAPPKSYEVPSQARYVAAVLDDHGLRGVTVVAHSSGGYVATSLAEQRPELVGALALVSTGPRPGALLPQPALLRVLTSPPLGALVWALRSDKMVRRGISVTAARPVGIADDIVADLKGITYRSFTSVLRENGAYIAERSIPERLADLDVPVLVAFGAADPRWDPSSARDYEVVPDAQIEMLPGVGHMAMLEAPDALATMLLTFAATGR